MRKLFFTVGPTKIYPGVDKALEKAISDQVLSMNHRGTEFAKLFDEAKENLRKLLHIPKDHHIFFLSSATEAMERIIENVVDTSSFHFVNGSFGKRFYQIAKDLKKDAQKIEVAFGKGFDFSSIALPKKIELVCLTNCDTSTGVAINLDEAAKIKRKNPHVLLALDTVSSVPYPKIDFAMYDLVFFSVQKGFGLPAGLGVLIISPKAMQKAKKLQKQHKTLGSYHTFDQLLQYAEKKQTPETPNVLAIYLLHFVCLQMLKKGINTIRKETDEKAEMLYDFFDTHPQFEVFPEKQFRSATVIVVEVKDGSTNLIKKLKTKGIILGSGYGPYKDQHIRIGNFSAHTTQDVKHLIKEIEKVYN